MCSNAFCLLYVFSRFKNSCQAAGVLFVQFWERKLYVVQAFTM